MFDVLSVGHAAFDIAFTVARHPGPDEKLFAQDRALGGGGPAATAACAIARLGGKVGFVGRLGQDLFGRLHAEELARFGVDLRWAVQGKAPAALSAVIVKPDGTRSIVNHKGSIEWLPTELAPKQASFRWLLADGHEPLIAEALLDRAPSLLDAGSLHAGTERLMRRVSVLAASERFACAIAQSDDPARMLAALRPLAPRVVITLGACGLVWASDGQTGAMPAFAVKAIDTTGAGDVFHGALALALAREMDWLDALRYAQAAAAIACTGFGARSALPSEEQVQRLLAEGSMRHEG